MKKVRLWFSVMAVIVLCITYGREAYAWEDTETQEVGDWKVLFTYERDDGTIKSASLAGYTGSDTELSLPTNLTVTLPAGECEGQSRKVTITGVRGGYWDNAFGGMKTLSSVIIPEGYTYIGSYAFHDCKALTSVTLPSTMLELGENAFENCISLTKIALPAKISIIPGSCFSECTSLTSVTFPANLVNIEEYAFYDCISLSDVVLPATMRSIGKCSFEKCSGITSLVLPEKVVTLEEGAFFECTSLTEITIPESVKTISYNTFYGCTSLASVSLPEGMTLLGDSAFESCTGLTEVTLPSTLVTIEKEAFKYCAALEKIVLPDKVVTLGTYAFDGCKSLKSVTLSKSIANFPDGVFYGCEALEEVAFSDKIVVIGENIFGSATNLKKINYSGTIAKWQNIKIAEYGNEVLEKAVVTCSDGVYHKIHDFTYKQTETVPATCSAEGTGVGECLCGAKENYKIPMLEHQAETVPYVAPTCTTAGCYQWSRCKVCGAEVTKKVEIAALGHKEVADLAVAATCTTDGKTAGSHCDRCGITLTAQQVIPATGHDFETAYRIDKLASPDADGSKSYHCKKCTATQGTVVIPAAKQITISKNVFVYNGKTQKPKVSVKDAKGGDIPNTQYTVTFASKSKAIGKYTVVVTFKDEYTGTKTLTYTIIPKNISIAKVTAGKKEFTVKWKAASSVTGYEIQYATNKNFSGAKTVSINKANTVKATVSKLKAGKKYFVRLRSYKKAGSSKIRSNWSKAKTVTTKK